MGRILAIDYGKKRTGIAVSDTLRITANALTTIDSQKIIYWLKDYFKQEEVNIILLGYSTHADGSPNEITPKIDKLYSQLQKLFSDKEIILRDEAYTSKMAFQTMIDSGLSKKARQNKGMIDQISAAIILQEYLGNI
jgi:putative Holliday junction resolvase